MSGIFLQASVRTERPQGFISSLNTNCTVVEGDTVRQLAYVNSCLDFLKNEGLGTNSGNFLREFLSISVFLLQKCDDL